MSDDFKMGHRNIGALQDNKPKNDKDREIAKKVLSFNLKVMEMGKTKVSSIQELEDRFVTYLSMCANEGLPPTIERSRSLLWLV